MPTHVALLRGINVGGNNKIPMAELRQVVSALGHCDVSTYIQSGNVIFTPSRGDAAELARELEAAIEQSFGVRSPVVVVSRDELAEVITLNPYPGEPNPKFVHGVFLPAEPDEAGKQWVAETAARAAQGTRDEATLVGRVLYVHTPDGFGTSELAKELLAKKQRANPMTAGTARNWSTVTKLLALCG